MRVKLLKKNEAIESKLKEVTKNLLFIFFRNIFLGGSDGSQAYLVLQLIHRYV